MSFIDVRFPIDISYGSQSAIGWRTNVVILDSGYERRRQVWSVDQGKWNVGYGIRDWDDLYAIYSLFHVMRGKAHTFRFKDWLDYEVITPMEFGIGDGSDTTFQLTKTYDYTGSSNPYIKAITKPVAGTVQIYFGAVEQFSGFSINYATGLVTFSPFPPTSTVIKWSGEHDKHVRFDSDEFNVALEAFQVGDVPQIMLLELKEAA